MSAPEPTPTETPTEPAAPAPETISETIPEGNLLGDAPASEGPSPETSPEPEKTTFSDWDMARAALPEDQKTLAWLQNTKSLEDLVSQTDNLQKTLGNAFKIPDPENLAEIRNAMTKLGCPESPGDYDLGEFTPPEGIGWDDDLLSKTKELMHQIGLTNDQVKQLVPGFAELQFAQAEETLEVLRGQHDTTLESLKKEYGGSFDNLLHNGLQAGYNLVGETEFRELMEMPLLGGGALGNHQTMAKLMLELASRSGSHDIIGTAGRAPAVARTPQNAEAEIRKLQADAEFMRAYADRKGTREELAAADQRMRDLHVEAYGTSPVDTTG